MREDDPEGLPLLATVLEGAADRIASYAEIGLLSVTVLQRRHVEQGTGWQAYDAIVREIAAFLREYRRERMRREDRLFESSMSGNTFALLLGPPRHGRALGEGDLARVRMRLRRGLKVHLARRLPKDVSDMSLPVRCIIRTDSPPYLPTIYNNNFHIFQAPGYVAIAPEMIHSARIIPLDGRPHLGANLHQWLGDTRGRWDGPTLVVETTNFRPEEGVVFQNANPATFRITERFTRVDADTLNYEFTVEDPATWTRPWSARIPWTKIDPDEQMYEYACHEDNYDIVHFLSGARSREKRGETK